MMDVAANSQLHLGTRTIQDGVDLCAPRLDAGVEMRGKPRAHLASTTTVEVAPGK